MVCFEYKGTVDNPILGDTRHPQELGYKFTKGKYIWHACIDCGKQRWVIIKKGKPQSDKCPSCGHKGRPPTPDIIKEKLSKIHRGKGNYNWNGGRHNNGHGYIKVYLYPDNPFYPMACKDNCVLEHRLVMAKHLGRCLKSWEIVHHKHTKYPIGSIEDKQDNRIENLHLISIDKHNQITILEAKIKYKDKQIKKLKEEIIRLKSKGEFKEMNL